MMGTTHLVPSFEPLKKPAEEGQGVGNGKDEKWAGRAGCHRDNKTENRLGFGALDQRVLRATRGSDGEGTFGFLED